MKTQAKKRKRRLWPKLLLATFATLLALLAGEGLIRALDLAPRIRRIHVGYNDESSIYKPSSNPILGYELKANYRNDHSDYGFTCASTNSHGQHDVERKVEKPAGVRRVILLGDSVVESTEVRELDDMMNRQLEKLYSDGKTEVLNFGVGGYCTLGEVELLKVKGLQFKPDIVIVVFVYNDFDNFNSSIVEALEAPSEQPSWLFQQLFVHSAMFRLASVELKLVPTKLPDDPASWNNRAIGDNNVVEGLRRLREMSQEYGFQAAVAVWPEFRSDEIVDLAAMPDSDELIVESIARTYGIPTYRMSDYFKRHRESIQPPPNPNDYYTVGDKMHANVQGSRVAAEALRELIDSLPDDGAATTAADAPQLDPRVLELAKAEGKHKTEFDLVNAMCLAAHSHLASGNVDQAIQHYEQALEIDPKCYNATSSLVKLLIDRGALDAAEARLREALELNPKLADAHFNLGYLLVERGELEEAGLHFDEALRCDPNFAQAHIGLALIFQRQGRMNEARRQKQLFEQLQAAHQDDGDGK